MPDWHFFDTFCYFHFADFGANLQNSSWFDGPLNEGPVIRRFNVRGCLVRLHDVDRIVSTDGVAWIFKEFN